MLTSPYRLDGTVQLGVSGGRTSGYLFKHILDAHGGKLSKTIIPTFQNTGEESEETLEFVHRMEKHWFPITWLEWDDDFRLEDYVKPDGELSTRRLRGQEKAFRVVNYQTASREGEPFDRMLDYYAEYRRMVKKIDPGDILPTLVTRMCTSHLKIKPSERYMRHRGFEQWDRCIGIRCDEPKRYAEAPENWSLPLVQAGVTKKMINDWWKKQSFNLALDEESIEGNCTYCFLKKPDKLLAIMRKRMKENGQPDESLLRWIRREKLAGLVFRQDRPPYVRLYQIARKEKIEGKTNEYDFSLVPEFKCTCEGTTGEDED